MENRDAYIDTDVIIRLLTSDDAKKQERAYKLFEKVESGELELSAPATVIADAVYVLSSPRLYNRTRTEIREMLSVLLRLSNFKIDCKQALLSALDLYVEHNIDFGDALLASLVLQGKSKYIYSYDHDFNKITGIKRKEP